MHSVLEVTRAITFSVTYMALDNSPNLTDLSYTKFLFSFFIMKIMEGCGEIKTDVIEETKS